jgi:alcohol dehydrogenase (NADP+)
MKPDKVKHFCQLSLKNLGLAYLDLYLIQLPLGIRYKNDEELLTFNIDGSLATECVTELGQIWMEMEKLVDEGLVNNIGVSNFNIQQLEKILESAIIKPANLQIEVHAYFQQRDIRAFCRENGIPVTAYCPLGKVSVLTSRTMVIRIRILTGHVECRVFF